MKSWHSHVDVGKKVLASAVSAAMVVAFTPVVAMGATVDPCTENACTHKAKAGTAHYDTLAEAVSAAPNDGTLTTIELLAPESISAGDLEISSGQNIVFDLNGASLSFTDSKRILVKEGAKLLVEDTSAEKSGTINANAQAIRTMGDLTVAGGSITGGSYGIISTATGNAVVTGGVISGATAGIQAQVGGHVTVNGGAISSAANGIVCISTSKTDDTWVRISNAKVTANCGVSINGNRSAGEGRDAYPAKVYVMDGADIAASEGDTPCGVFIIGKGAQLDVSGGSIKGSAYAISGNGTKDGTNDYGDTEINISGGRITETGSNGGGAIYQPQSGKLIISGSPAISGENGVQLCSGEGLIGSITGGSITATGNDNRADKTGDGFIPDGAALSIVNRSYPGGTPKLTVTGGTFKSAAGNAVLAYTWSKNTEGKFVSSAWAEAKQYLSLQGGIFSSDPTALLAEGSKVLHKSGSLFHAGTTESLTSSSSAATCTSAGYSSTYCAECGYVASSSSTPALGHSWGSAVVTTPATETSEGIATSTCGRCGATQTSVLAKLPASGSDTTAIDESGTKVDVTVTDNTPTMIPGTTTPAAGTVTYNGTEAAAGSAPATTATVPSTVTIGGSTYVVTAIAPEAFEGQEQLTSVTIPETVTTIGESAFAGCTSLTSVSVPAGVTTIESSTFANCTNLTTVEVKGELTEIAADAFNGCTNLSSMTVAGTVKPMALGTLATTGSLVLPESVTKVGDRAFKGTGITSVTIPAGVKMGSSVFRDCKQLTKAVVEKGVKTLSSYTFKGCSKLTKVTVPSGVTEVGRSAFSNCKSLTSLTLPSTCKAAGKNMLYGTNVKNVAFKSTKLTKASVKGCLAGSKVTTVKVPKSKVAAYKKLFTKANCGRSVTVKALASK